MSLRQTVSNQPQQHLVDSRFEESSSVSQKFNKFSIKVRLFFDEFM